MAAQFRWIRDRCAGDEAGAYCISRVRGLGVRWENEAGDKNSEESEHQHTTPDAWQIERPAAPFDSYNTKHEVIFHQEFADMKIAIPGGTGQVGTLLARAFHQDGHCVIVFGRSPKTAPWRVVRWNPANVTGWQDELDGADVVINLAGRSVNPDRFRPEVRSECHRIA